MLNASNGIGHSKCACAPEVDATWQIVQMKTGDQHLERKLSFLRFALPRRAAAGMRPN